MSTTIPLPVTWRRRWLSTRRFIGIAALTPLTWWGLSAAGGGLTKSSEIGWIVAVAFAAAITATTLASYLPLEGSGTRLDLGCGRCAMMAAISVPMAGVVLSTGPGQAGTASIALLITGFGLMQRLRDPGVCSTGPSER